MLNAKSTQEKAGDILEFIIPASGYSAAFLLDDEEGKIEFYKSFFGTFATITLLKESIDKRRPDGSGMDSFPSGHTTFTFQGATFIHLRYGFKYSILPYIGATFVGYTRVDSQKHYLEDVLAGAFMGTTFSYIFTKPFIINDMNILPVVFYSKESRCHLYGVDVRF